MLSELERSVVGGQAYRSGALSPFAATDLTAAQHATMEKMIEVRIVMKIYEVYEMYLWKKRIVVTKRNRQSCVDCQ